MTNFLEGQIANYRLKTENIPPLQEETAAQTNMLNRGQAGCSSSVKMEDTMVSKLYYFHYYYYK